MPLPDRPVSGEVIAVDWGQEIHDRVLAAKGAEVNTGTTRTVSTTAAKCHLDVAVSDPGSFLDGLNDQVEVPTGGEGLYLITFTLDSVNGDTTSATRAHLYLNGSSVRQATESNEGAVHVSVTVTSLVALTAGDILSVFAQYRGTSGTNPTVQVTTFQLIRLTDDYGA
jgi:hypothetical protein